MTFQFFINPNKLFNSGLSGVIQVVTNYFFVKNGVGEQNRIVYYYAIVLLVNSLIVSVIQFFYPYNFEINSTAIFYVFSQFIWSSIFRRYSLQKYFFSRFSAQSWSNLSSLNQLGLTFPFYITIGVVSAIIHTYGYNLIYRAKSTPGGFEIITSTLAQDKKEKVSIGSLNKLFAVSVILFITVFNFLVVNDNIQLKTNELIDLINSNMHTILNRENRENQMIIKGRDGLDSFLKSLNGEKFDNVEKLNIRELLENWSGDHSFEKLPGGISTYLEDDKKILQVFSQLEKAKKAKLWGLWKEHKKWNPENSKVVTENEKEELLFLSHIRARTEEVKKNTYEKSFLGYFKYITNDEKLWASLIYIFFSSYLINQIFPKSKTVLLTVLLESSDNLGKMLSILQKYSPSYFQVLSKKGEREEENYFLFCSITKWNYLLLANEISKFGKISVNILDESN